MANSKCGKLLTFSPFVAIVMSTTCHSDIIFHDDFSLAPNANGWSQLTTATSSAVGSISLAPSGGQVTLDKTSGSGPISFSISRSIPTLGFEQITLNLTAFQSNTGFESSDFLEIEYDSGAGFVTLLRDVEVWNGVNDLTGEASSGADGQTEAVSTGDILLPADAFDNSLFQIRINGVVNANAEDYFLDNLLVRGSSTAIPETSALLGFGVLTCFVLGKRAFCALKIMTPGSHVKPCHFSN